MARALAVALLGVAAGVGCLVDIDRSLIPDATPIEDASGDAAIARDAATDAPSSTGGDATATDPSLVGEWLFDEASSPFVALDTSGKDRHATLVAGAEIVADGRRGGALHLRGGSDLFTVDALSGASFPQSGTLSLHLRYTFAEDDTVHRSVFDRVTQQRSHIFFRRGYSAPPQQFQIAFQAAGSAALSANILFKLPRDTWSHIVIGWDELDQQGFVFVNGTELLHSRLSPQCTFTDQLFRIGDAFVGLIDEVRLYDRALKPSEVLAIP